MAITDPRINIKILPASVELIAQEQKLLFIGQKTALGSAAGGTLVENIGNNNEQDALFGLRSQLAGMIRAAKAYNKNTRMDAIVLDDEGGSTAATATYTIAGTATEDGSLTFNIVSRVNHSFTITVTDTDDATTIAGNLVSAITADTKAPFTAANVAGVVTLTAENKGLAANSFGVENTGAVAGVTVTPVSFSGGTVDPVLDTPLTLIDDVRYQTIVFPFSYTAQSVLIDLIEKRFNPELNDDKPLDGVGIATLTDTLANIIANTTAANLQMFAFIPNRLVDQSDYKGSGIFEADYSISSQFAAVRALRLTQGADISEFVITQSPNNDNFGGISASTLPYFNTPFKNLPLVDKDVAWSNDERASLLAARWSVLGNNHNSNGIIADFVVTRYKTDSAGDPDDSFKFLNYVDQAVTVRDVFHTQLREVYAQSRLTKGALVQGFNVTNADDIKSQLIAIYEFLADNVVVPAGPQSLRTFKNSIIIVIDQVNGKVTIQMLDPVVTQLREITANMQLTFSLN